MLNILILNVNTAQNLGDDAIFDATIRSVKEKYPLANITVAANDPGSWQKYSEIQITSSLCTWVADCRLGLWQRSYFLLPLFIGFLLLATIFYRLFRIRFFFGNPEKRRLLSAYYEAHLVLSSAGGYLFTYNARSPMFILHLLTIGLALGLGKKVIMLPQSIGPIKYGYQRTFAKFILNRVSTIMVRERISFDYSQKLTPRKSPILFPDVAFGLPKSVPSLPGYSLESQKNMRIGVTVIDFHAQNPSFKHQQDYEDILLNLLADLNKEYSADIFLFVQCYGPHPAQDDRQVTKRLYKRLKLLSVPLTLFDSFNDSSEIRAAFGAMDLLIGTRMHSGILALINEIPLILIGYQPKTYGMMELFGFEDYCCDIDGMSGEKLYPLAREAISQRNNLAQDIAIKLTDTQNKLRNWSKYLEI